MCQSWRVMLVLRLDKRCLQQQQRCACTADGGSMIADRKPSEFPVWWLANINPITSLWTVALGSQGGLGYSRETEHTAQHSCVCVCFEGGKDLFFPEIKYLTAERSDNYCNKVIAVIAIRDSVWCHVQSVIGLFDCGAAKSIVHSALD